MKFYQERKKLLGSEIEIKLPKKSPALFSSCFDIFRDIEKRYSRFLEDSELSYLNKNRGRWASASDEFIYLLEISEELKKRTQGNFDICVKSTLDRIGYDKDYSFSVREKSSETLTRKIIDRLTRPFKINKKEKKVLLNKEIDFGGFGKGYAIDKAAGFLKSKGLNDFYINAGGDIFARSSPGNNPWTILLEHPDDTEKAIGKIELDDHALGCSAPNRRKWKGQHHLINPKKKEPENSVKAIFVKARTALEADAYATALFCAGFEKGIQLSEKLPVEILIISSRGKMYKSSGFDVAFFE